MLALTACVAALMAADPFAPGSHKVNVVSGKLPSDLKWDYRISAPTEAGSYPVMTYVTGFGGVVPGSLYGNLTDSIAAEGVVVITLSRIASPAPVKDAALLAASLPWFQANASGLVAPAVPDWDKYVMSAHSAGNHVNCDFLQNQCGPARAIVMMDPVDGFDPYGIVKNYCITPGQKVNFTIPALLLRCGLDPKHASALEPPCAPDNLSNDRFYDAWRGPIWEVNATQMGHADLLNPGISGFGSLTCPSGKKEANVLDYIRQIAGLTKSFLDLVFGGDASAEQTLTTTAGMPMDSQANKNNNGFAPPFKGGCTHL
eukprot:Hpha_TRINITY_DN15295_c3_g11::TRINITY_DN15295_c3_g11_i1::g.68473::m.68473/K08099/E3.1.1.14; chlorophyllase